jgi:xeroderma pigmentosum group C-complementing protein
MPPFIPRKRQLSTPPPDTPPPVKKHKKSSLFDAVDQRVPTPSVAENKQLLESLASHDDDESVSDAGSSDFEDAIQPAQHNKAPEPTEEEEGSEIDWENALLLGDTLNEVTSNGPAGHLELTLNEDSSKGAFTNDKKKGPSKLERHSRIGTHCMHVQFLLFHNVIRNGWICDKKVQEILVKQLPEQIKAEVNTWKRASGLEVQETYPKKYAAHTTKQKKARVTTTALVRTMGKGKNKIEVRAQRDWGTPAERLEMGAPNMSRGDPIIRLLKYLAAYWKKRFRITAPGIRKHGYKSLAVLAEEITAFNNGDYDIEVHGERIENLDKFRECARECEGSRDVGAQLFTALIRGLGIGARMVASLQPLGFGWSKGEESVVKKKKAASSMDNTHLGAPVDDTAEHKDSPASSERNRSKTSNGKKKVVTNTVKSKLSAGTMRGGKNAPIQLSEDDGESSSLSSAKSDTEDSVIDVTLSAHKRRPNANYDRDLPFPHYWVEVISPLTHEVFPVDPIVLNPAVATSQDHLAAFEPRGAKAEKAKQVIAYVIAFSADGTAKDVTTRYLKRHMWPGKTKTVRLPPEKVPILNKRGKVKRYEEYDWFKSVMSAYTRPYNRRTPADDIEDSKDLKPVKHEKRQAYDGIESLQGYKQSAEFVLERHLRREEALRPASKPVKFFKTGKADKAKEEPVYRRSDVVVCRTAESWHKEGRRVKNGEYPLKMVPIRAVTLARKREAEEIERETGEKSTQGMYAKDQTEWIIPPPIQNGVIPKNAFGNIDCFVPSMVPKGAVHIPLRGTVKICKRLDIDYAEAVTGFEFGNQRAVPVIDGVVVAAENEYKVLDEWEKDEEKRRIKEDGKREAAALAMWRKFLMGLRIIERVNDEYGIDSDGHLREEMNPFTNKNKRKKLEADTAVANDNENGDNAADLAGNEEDLGGGFLAESEVEDDALGSVPEATEVAEEDHLIIEGNLEKPGRPLAHQPPNGEVQLKFVQTLDDTEGSSELSEDEPVAPATKVNRHTVHDDQLSENDTQSDQPLPKKPARRSKPAPKRQPTQGKDPSPRTVQSSVEKPRRKAAGKQKTALKSSYFADNSEIDNNSIDDGSSGDDEDEDVYKPAGRKAQANGKGKGKASGNVPTLRRGRSRQSL